MKNLTILSTFIFFSLKTFATNYYVDASKSDNSGAGTSWATAKKDVQNAIDIATSGDQIWIKSGTYYPTVDLFNSTSPTDSRDKTFFVKNGISLYGGFAGTETLLSQRNISNNPTILSGDIGTLNSNSDNCYHVVSCIGNTVASTFDGLIIADGTTTTSSSSITVNSTSVNRNRAAGIMITHAALVSITYNIKNCVLKNHLGGNGNGAAANVFNANLNIENSVFSNNSVTQATVGNGLGLNFSGTTLTILNSVFVTNQYTTAAGGSGGAIQTTGSSNTFTNCTFSDNKVGASGSGGAIYFANSIHTSLFTNCLFYNNLKGSSSSIYGSDILFNGNSTNLTTTNCMLQLSQSSDYVSVTTGLNAASSGNIFNNTNPVFVNSTDIDGVDNKYFTSDDGLSLQTGSPAINAGTSTGAPTTDITSVNRSGNPDIGAYEYSSPITSSTWNGSIWSNGLPTASIDAIIASSTTPTSFTCKGLTINSGVSLSTTGITATVNGNIINNGNGISGTGNLIVNANSTLSGSAISFNGVLSVSTGATLSTSGLLTITSNSTTTGSVGTSAGSITGNVTVQRYIPGDRRAFRFISHPFSSSLSLSSLTDNIDITGTGGSPLTSTLSNAPSAYSYDNSIGNSSLSNDPGWVALSSSSVFNSKTGYRILIRGSKGQTGSLTGGTYTPDPVTLDWTGTLNQGNQIVTLTNNGTNRDYSLIGNPYASPVNLSLTSRGSSINANFSVWNPNLLSKGGYETQAFSSSYILPSGAAFFAQTTSNSNNTITFTESSKSTSAASAIFRNSNTEEMLHLELLDSKGNYADKLIFYINPNNKDYTSQNDALWDAVKLINPEVNIYSLSKDKIQLSVDRRASLEESVQLGFTGIEGGYSIVVKELPTNTSVNYYLKDNYLQKQTLLQKGESIPVSIDVESASQGIGRLEIVSQPKSKYTTSSKIEINLSPNPAKDVVTLTYNQASELNTKVVIINAVGKKVQTINLGKVQSGTRKIDISRLSSGVYFVQYENGEERRTEKLIIK